MSELSKLANSPANLIPGYTLSRMNLSATGAVEETFKRFYMSLAGRSTVDLSSEQQSAIVARAGVDADYYFVDGTVAFAQKTKSAEGILTTLFESIRILQPRADYQQVINLLNTLPKSVLNEANDWCWEREKKEPAQSVATPGAHGIAVAAQTGPGSSNESVPNAAG